MPVYTWINRVLSEYDVEHSKRLLYKLLSSYWDRVVLRTLSNTEDGASCKRIMPEGSQVAKKFSGQGRFRQGTRVLTWTFYQKCKNKRVHREKFWSFLSWILHLQYKPKNRHNQGLFFQYKITFLFFNPGRPPILPSSCTLVISISQNTAKYPWKCLNKLF